MENSENFDWKNRVQTDVKGITRKGILSVGGFGLAFCVWAVLFPLSSSVIALGAVTSAGQNKLIQHQFGGAVAKIHALDGQRVNKGDPIFTLDPIVDQSQLNQFQSRRSLLLAVEARLVAELDDSDKIDFPDELTSTTSEGLRGGLNASVNGSFHIRNLINDQINTWKASRKTFQQEVSALGEQILSFENQIAGQKARRNSAREQFQILNSQIKSMRPLVKQGYVSKIQFSETRRLASERKGELENTKSEIASLTHRIGETKARISQVNGEYDQRLSNDLVTTRGELAEITAQITAALSTVQNRNIKAPVTGVMVKSVVHTIGGIVRAGDTVAEIVPEGAEPLIEARIAPEDIDSVHKQQAAKIIITAYNGRLYDPISAKVEYVAADSSIDSDTGIVYFAARLKLSEEPTKFNRISDLRSGMVAEIFIETGARTFLSYLVKPISDSFRRAFQER